MNRRDALQVEQAARGARGFFRFGLPKEAPRAKLKAREGIVPPAPAFWSGPRRTLGKALHSVDFTNSESTVS